MIEDQSIWMVPSNLNRIDRLKLFQKEPPNFPSNSNGCEDAAQARLGDVLLPEFAPCLRANSRGSRVRSSPEAPRGCAPAAARASGGAG